MVVGWKGGKVEHDNAWLQSNENNLRKEADDAVGERYASIRTNCAWRVTRDLTWASKAITSEQVCQNTAHTPALHIRINI